MRQRCTATASTLRTASPRKATTTAATATATTSAILKTFESSVVAKKTILKCFRFFPSLTTAEATAATTTATTGKCWKKTRFKKSPMQYKLLFCFFNADKEASKGSEISLQPVQFRVRTGWRDRVMGRPISLILS